MNNLQLIEQVLYYIDEHISEPITFEHLAEQFGYSAFHFHRIFSTVTEQTITDYMKKLMIDILDKHVLQRTSMFHQHDILLTYYMYLLMIYDNL